jgi:uncharacterized protein
MAGVVSWFRRNSALAGVALMFLFTWPMSLANEGFLPSQLLAGVSVLLGYGIVLASVLMTALTLGKPGVTALLKRYLIWRVGWKWYGVALLLYPLLFLAAIGFSAWRTHQPVDYSQLFAYTIFGSEASLLVYVIPFFLFDALTNGEEIGWRGFLLPRLQTRFGFVVSSLIVGLLWGVWHIPRYLAPGEALLFGWYMVKTVADAFVYTWLYNHTRGSLLLVTLLHASANTAGVFLPLPVSSPGNLGPLAALVWLEILLVTPMIWFEVGSESQSNTAPLAIQRSSGGAVDQAKDKVYVSQFFK